MGISAVKIVGREASSLRKLASLRLVRAVVEKTRNAMDEEIQTYAQALRQKVAPCVPGEMCYYELGATACGAAREKAASTPSSVG
jgi:putative protease